MTTENVDFKKPQPIMRKAHLNPNKQCLYHNDTCHHIDDCVSLRNEIEQAIKSVKLENLLKNVRQGASKQPAQADNGPPQKRVKYLNVHMIQGGRLR